MDFTRPLWVGHYGLCFKSHIGKACMAIKGNNKHRQLIKKNKLSTFSDISDNA